MSDETVVTRIALIRDGEHASALKLIRVTRESESRIYGTLVEGYGYWFGAFVSRDKLVKMNATPLDHAQAVSAVAERDRRIQAARAWFEQRLAEIAQRQASEGAGT
jgi:hypothetical protein